MERVSLTWVFVDLDQSHARGHGFCAAESLGWTRICMLALFSRTKRIRLDMPDLREEMVVEVYKDVSCLGRCEDDPVSLTLPRTILREIILTIVFEIHDVDSKAALPSASSGFDIGHPLSMG